MSGLFQVGEFMLAGGSSSDWKIDCDALAAADWDCLALLASRRLPPFGPVEGVPSGGLPFADSLRKYSRSCVVGFPHPAHDWCEGNPFPLLIAEDVVTTGRSMERVRAGRDAIGVTAFARGIIPDWVTPVFLLASPAVAGGMIPDPPVCAKPRSPHWPSARAACLMRNPVCLGCGSDNQREVHHLIPYHLRPDLELVQKNLITACRPCHFVICHLGSWSRYNPTAESDMNEHRIRVNRSK